MVTTDQLKPTLSSELNRLAEKLNTNPEQGLTEQEAKHRLAETGPNELHKRRPYRPWLIFLNQFRNSIVFLLLAAATISFFFGDFIEMVAILLVILINAIIGFILEIQAHRSMEALRSMDQHTTRVIRDGEMVMKVIREIVPGDILYAEAGDLIAADARIVRSTHLEVNESLLTGESVPVSKSERDLPEAKTVADQENMLFRGTSVTRGNATAMVIHTGMTTEIGKISEMVFEADKEEVPLNRKLERLSRKLIWLTLAIIVLFVLVGLWTGKDLYTMIETGIALAVAAIPEGLPIVATIALARGMLRMARQKVLVKKMAAVETLGETDLIMTDKTGTLTENRLEVKMVVLPGPYGKPLPAGDDAVQNADHLIQVAVLCNNARLDPEGKGVGDPLEVALLEYAQTVRPEWTEHLRAWERTGEQPFESESRIMITRSRHGEKEWLAMKGSPAEVMERSEKIHSEEASHSFSSDLKEHWAVETRRMAAEGFKVLAFAWATQDQEFIFAGLIGFSDPPREDVKEAIATCHQAGIDVVMVTGDHPETARAIALQTGLIKGPDEKVVHGADLGEITPENAAAWTGAKVFSRVSPAQKLGLMDYYKSGGLVVAMTGDGVNDAPALRKSDIGIAMGLRGTQVAKEASDMILEDDAFSSIVRAVRQGRIIFNNIRHFVVYLISCNLSEILIVSAGAFFAIPLPLLPLQILFLNIVTDVFPALALGMGGESGKMMEGKFHQSGKALLDGARWRSIAGYAMVLTLAVLFVYLYSLYQLGATDQEANNIAFYTLAFAQLVHPFNLIRGEQSFFRNEIIRNPHLWGAILFCTLIMVGVNFIPFTREALALQHLPLAEIELIVLGSLAPLPVIRILKLAGYAARRRKQSA